MVYMVKGRLSSIHRKISQGHRVKKKSMKEGISGYNKYNKENQRVELITKAKKLPEGKLELAIIKICLHKKTCN